MKFDKSKILTVVTADQAKVGQKGWFADDLYTLMRMVKNCTPKTVWRVGLEGACRRFMTYQGISFALFYPAPELTYRPFHDDELNDIVGKVVVQNHTGNAMLIIKIVDSETGKVVSLGGSQKRNSQQLLDGWVFKDGHPCGVKEEIR